MKPEERAAFDAHVSRMTRETMFLIEATDFEQHCLWEQTHKRCRWEQINPGLWERVGHLAARPVAISVSWARIDGRVVAIWTMTSQVTDSVMAETWLSQRFGEIKWGGGRRAWTNAQNFHHALEAIRESFDPNQRTEEGK